MDDTKTTTNLALTITWEWFRGQRLIEWIRLAFDVWKTIRAQA